MCALDLIAAAVEAGADGVVLLANVLGQHLETLLNAATIMGTEAIVEVGPASSCLRGALITPSSLK